MTERGLHDKVVDEPLLARVLAVTEENLPVATKDRTTDAMFALVHFDCFQADERQHDGDHLLHRIQYCCPYISFFAL